MVQSMKLAITICPFTITLLYHWAATFWDTLVFTCSTAISNVVPAPAVRWVPAHRVHLSEHRALSEEQWLPGVDQDQIEVRLPGSVGGSSLWRIQTHTRIHKQTTRPSPSLAYSAHFRVWSKLLPLGHGGSQTGRSWFSMRTQQRQPHSSSWN